MRKLSTLCFLALLALPAAAQRFGDVEVSPIPGESAQTTHGYAPYRFRVQNTGQQPVRVGLTLGNDFSGQGLSSLRREAEVPAHAAVEMVLHQPAETFYSGRCRVAINGRRQDDELSVPTMNHGQRNYGGMGDERFVLTSTRVATEDRDALTFSPSAAKAAAGGGSSPLNDSLKNVPAASPVPEWPTDWLSFTRWDAVALTRDEFETAPPAVRAGLENWVRAGGQLLVLRAGAKDVPAQWKDGMRGAAGEDDDDGGALVCRVGLGRALFVPTGAARGAGQAAFHRACDMRSPALATPNCAPVASGQVPVRGMFFLMLAFAVLVGPVNYVLCARKNKRIWLLWTSPAIAAVFVGAVFAYALLSDGIRPWGRTVAVTLLDGKSHRAVTRGTTAWYAPMLPSEGLRFGAATEVRAEATRDWNDRREGMGVVLGADQRLTGGWMVPRFPDSFGYRKVEDSRLRMTFEKEADGSFAAVNGLGVPVDGLEIRGAKTMHCGAIPAGGRAKLLPGPGALPSLPGQSPSTPMPVQPQWRGRYPVPVAAAPAASASSSESFAMAGDHWRAQLSTPLFAEIPFDNAKSHEVSETVIGPLEEPLK